jgi:hypothetical protein
MKVRLNIVSLLEKRETIGLLFAQDLLDPDNRLVDRLLGADALGCDAVNSLRPDPLVPDPIVSQIA